MKPISNHVHILLTRKTDEINVADKKLYIDTSYNEEAHRPIVGIVRGLPDKLYFKDQDWDGMPWDTEIELQVGDEVVCKRPDVTGSISYGKTFTDEEGLHVFVPYSSIVVAKRKGKIICVNGFILVEPEIEEFDVNNIIVPDVAKKPSKLYGIVRHIGKPLKAYHTMKNSRGHDASYSEDTDDIKVGDRIAFNNIGDIYLEYDIHQSLEGRGKPFFRMQRHKVIAICNLKTTA